MLELKESSHTVLFNGYCMTLQPLSFRLFEALMESPKQTVSAEKLTKHVWGNTAISPETLKQRIFVLRKAIGESGIQGLSIQSIRGEGYRLLIDQPELATPKLLARRGKFTLVASLAIALIFAFSYFIYSTTTQFSINNRVVLWTNIATHEMPPKGQNAYEEWLSLLSNKTDHREFQLVFSKRIENMLITDQARENRAGLISNFEMVGLNKTPSIRLSIIEPTTAAVIRSDIVGLTDEDSLKNKMQSHLRAIENLVFSKAICLSSEQREDPQNPIWKELKRIANQP